MPLYEYELCEGSCAVCGGKFTLRRPLSAAPLTNCPACKKPVRRIWSTFNSPKTVSISDAKKAGLLHVGLGHERTPNYSVGARTGRPAAALGKGFAGTLARPARWGGNF